MFKQRYQKELTTENNSLVGVGTYEKDSNIYIKLVDNVGGYSLVSLDLKEAQHVKRYLEDAITTNIMNWEEE